ncbi:hypothetical protein [Prescottella equi]|uniref:hypothetical protein n=1 Tax=Rhodococcus hoagii TaxID=43767 RepID=UPI00111C0AF5|nr:hypothetical protein [Prescottella equi]
MSLHRFSVANVINAHWKGLSKPARDGEAPEPDKVARLVLVLAPLMAGITMFGFQVQLTSPAIIVAALSLLTGALLTVFTQLSTLRLKLTEWYDRDDVDRRPDKDSIDESVAHVLVAALVSISATIVAVFAIALGDEGAPALRGVVAAITVALITYVLLLLIMLIPRLYGAYASVHDVADELNGQITDRTNRHMRRLN